MRIFSIFILLLFALQGNAQNKLRTGLILGYNSSKFIGKDTPGIKQKPLPGFYIGGIIDYPIHSHIRFNSNVALGLRGTKINTFSEQYENVYGIYIDIPLLLKVNLLRDKPINPFLIGGCAIDNNILIIGHGPLYDIKMIDIGFVSGIGVGSEKLELSVRYNYGLNSVDKSELDQHIKNSTLSILFGIYFK